MKLIGPIAYLIILLKATAKELNLGKNIWEKKKQSLILNNFYQFIISL